MTRFSRARALVRGTTLAAACGTALTLLHGAVPAQAADGSLVAQWRFDEGDGQVAHDDGPFGLDGVLGSTAGADPADPARIAGASGGALHFGGDSIVSLPDSPRLALSTLTAQAVVRAPASPGAFRYILSRGGEGCVAGSYGLYTAAAGGVALYVFEGTRFVVSAAARASDVWDGQWHSVAGTFDGHVLRLFVDGRAVGDPMDAPLRIDYDTPSTGGSIGQYAGDCDLPFVGDIDLVRLTSGALSPESIALTGRADLLPPGSPLPPLTGPVPPLPAAAPGTILPGAAPDRAPAGKAPAKAPACAVRLSRTRITAARRSVVQARVVADAGTGRLKLAARRGKHGKALATARTSAKGVARLVLDVRGSGRLTIAVVGRPSCTPAYLKVAKRRAQS
jgi:hypothetical protein